MPALRAAAKRLSAASGYRLRVTTTHAAPATTGDHPGHGAPDVLVAAARPGIRGFDDPGAAATAHVEADPTAGGRLVIQRAVILVNTRAGLTPGWGTNGMTGTLAHELGHTLGLDHVSARTGQLMGPYGAPRLGAGDITGLRALRRASCG